jgi:hypothetical protein
MENVENSEVKVGESDNWMWIVWIAVGEECDIWVIVTIEWEENMIEMRGEWEQIVSV